MIDIQMLMDMTHNKINNYVIPGLSSSMIGYGSKEHGCARIFECSRDHREVITPHSHRFDFQALVLQGEVHNEIWNESTGGDFFTCTELIYGGEVGNYVKGASRRARYTPEVDTYGEGEWYQMKHDEIHSIMFEKGTVILFLEGPRIIGTTQILEPCVNSVTVPTFEVKDWMFK